MKQLKIMLPLGALGVVALAGPVYAHGFGERTELPVPLGFFMIGAGVAVALSFAVIGLFVKSNPASKPYPRYNIFQAPLLPARLSSAFPQHRWLEVVLTNRLLLLPLRLLSVFLLGLVVASGLLGDQTPAANFAPTFVWIIWWVSMALAVALVGNLWALINPLAIIFGWAEVLYGWFSNGRRLSLNMPYPAAWGIWPAVVLFLCFVWIQDAFPQSPLPSRVAVMAIVYSAITFGGMALFGKHQWLRHGEAFAVVFSFLARFAPTEARVRDQELCHTCNGRCLDQDGDCVNCYECFERAGARELNVRPFGMGLARNELLTTDMLAIVVLLLATVTYDGFSATLAWVDFQLFIVDIFSPVVSYEAFNSLTVADTIGVLLFPVAFLLVYLVFTYFMARSVGEPWGALDLARVFAFSLIPIALAYNIAHFINLLLIQGQLIIPLASDPFGYGWDLFGTADYTLNLNVINARVLWFLSVAVIVLGHMLAVYLAHLVSLRTFPDRVTAMNSQYPLLTLMVLYTVVSLWIIAQPIVA